MFFGQERAETSWFEGVDDADALTSASPSSSKPVLSSLDIITGKEFIAVCLTMDQRGKAHCRVTACLTAIPLKNGPLFYQGCPSVNEANGRACRKRVDAFDFCSTCGVEVAPVPFLNLSKAAFRADDGEVFR